MSKLGIKPFKLILNLLADNFYYFKLHFYNKASIKPSDMKKSQGMKISDIYH